MKQHKKLWIWGWHSLLAACRNPERTIYGIYGTQDSVEKLTSQVTLTCPVSVVSPYAFQQHMRSLDAPHEVHQGLVAEVSPLPERSLSAWLKALEQTPDKPARLLVLDQVSDPQNWGSLLRSAAATGMDGILAPERSTPDLQGALAKIASGSLECVPVFDVPNLAWALRLLKQNQFWCVGLMETGPDRLESLASSPRLALVLGSEGTGLRKQTQELCDFRVALETHPRFPVLNVATTGAIVMYCLRYQLF